MTHFDIHHAPGDPPIGSPDAYGQAALLLIESLLHTLIEQSVLTREAAIETVDVAADVKLQVASEIGDTRKTMLLSLSLLTAIKSTLEQDLS